MGKEIKLFGVYLAWHKNDVLPDPTPDTPRYPREVSAVRVYNSKAEQMECYANVPCPASQIIDATDKADLDRQVAEMKANFENEDWLKNNIDPYI